jgi:hypothetical protein
MSAAIHDTIYLNSNYNLTQHAWDRMCGRSLCPSAIRLVLNYGRAVHTRGAIIYVVGRKEVARFRREGVELSAVEGIQVVCSESRAVLTVYRNRDLRGLRPRARRTHHSYH